MRRKLVTFLATLGLASGLIVVTPANADAAFIAWICNDAACAGGDDLQFPDSNTDGIITSGLVSYNGLELVLNTSQSKPFLTNGMDLNFIVSNAAGTSGGSVWLYAADTGFVAPPNNITGHLSATVDTGSTVTGYLCGANNNSGPNPINTGCVSSGLISPPGGFATFGPLLATANPYSLALGVMVTIANGVSATNTGDLRATVPEPASLSLFGLALLGLGGAIRRRFAA